MRIILNTFILIFTLIFGVLVCFELIYANVKVTSAENFYETACSKIEEAYFKDGIIEECMSKAKERDYELSVRDESVDLYGEEIPAYYVTMKYPLKVGMFGIDRTVEINGYVN